MLTEKYKDKDTGLIYYLINPLEEPKNFFVLLHGYGANGKDLIPVAKYLNLKDTTFLNIQAPIGLPHFDGYAWYNLTFSSFEDAIRTKDYSAIKNYKDHDVDKSANKVIDLTQRKWNGTSKLTLGGFSQGSIISNYIFQNGWLEVDKLVLLSSCPMFEFAFNSKARAPKLFQSHGKLDPILPYSLAEEMYEAVKPSFEEHEFHSFNGAHEIPMDVLNNLKKFMEKS